MIALQAALFVRELAKRVSLETIPVSMCSPGMVNTDHESIAPGLVGSYGGNYGTPCTQLR